MHQRFFYYFFLASVVPLSIHGNNPSLATTSMEKGAYGDKNQEAAAQLILSLYEAARDICQESKTSEGEKISALTRLVQSHWDVLTIAQCVIWPHWKSFSPGEKNQFTTILTNNIVRTFYKVSKKYLGYLKIKKVAPIRGKDKAYEVFCEVLNKEDGMKAEVRFQIVSQRIRNLFVENLDLVAAKKTDYTALMRKKKQSYPEFLRALEKQIPGQGAPSPKG